MKSAVVSAFVIGLLLSSSPSFAAKTSYKAAIEGGAVGSPGTGVGFFTFDDVTKRLCGSATYEGLTGGPVTVAALKEGDAFSIVKPLTASASPLTIDVTLGDSEASLLETGPVYIAIGNATYGVAAGEASNGEVNGELVVDPAGVEQPCGATPTDAGPGSGREPDAGPSGTSPGDPAADSPPLSPDPAGGAKKTASDGGCSTSGASPSSGAIFGIVAALLAANRVRRRR